MPPTEDQLTGPWVTHSTSASSSIILEISINHSTLLQDSPPLTQLATEVEIASNLFQRTTYHVFMPCGTPFFTSTAKTWPSLCPWPTGTTSARSQLVLRHSTPSPVSQKLTLSIPSGTKSLSILSQASSTRTFLRTPLPPINTYQRVSSLLRSSWLKLDTVLLWPWKVSGEPLKCSRNESQTMRCLIKKLMINLHVFIFF